MSAGLCTPVLTEGSQKGTSLVDSHGHSVPACRSALTKIVPRTLFPGRPEQVLSGMRPWLAGRGQQYGHVFIWISDKK